jgi:hypothetical protein
MRRVFIRRIMVRATVNFSVTSYNSIGRKSALDATANQIAQRRSYHKPYASANLIKEYSAAEMLKNQRRTLPRFVIVFMNISG